MNWLNKSHHWQHLLGGIVIGILSLGCWYTAALAGIGVASTLEFKDKSWGGKWDWTDLIITVVGVIVGFGISFTFITFLL